MEIRTDQRWVCSTSRSQLCCTDPIVTGFYEVTEQIQFYSNTAMSGSGGLRESVDNLLSRMDATDQNEQMIIKQEDERRALLRDQVCGEELVLTTDDKE